MQTRCGYPARENRVQLRLDRLAVVAALSAGGCAAALALVAPAACIPDLPSTAAPDAAVETDTAPPVPRCGDGVVQLSLGEQCDPGATAQVGCSAACQIECDGGFHWSGNDHCYGVAPLGAVSITEAINARCSGGSHVVTFASEEELAAVVGALDAGAFWVGMYQGLTKYDSVTSLEPAWEPGCSGCFGQTAAPTQPLPGGDASTGCVEGFADLDASWQQYPCTGGKRIPVICEREPVGRLSQPCSLVDGGECFDLRFTHGAKSYVYVKLAAPADEAEQQCETFGGSLVVLQSRDEREQMWKELARMSGAGLPTAIWIGLTLPDGGTDWVWADDASVDAYAPPWAAREPRDGGTHVYMNQNGGTPPLVDDTLARVDTATGFYAFVCQLPARDW
jgi:cysteine-rich repeat protein